MRTRKRNNILMMTLVCVAVLGLGLGFAAFASNLTIKSTAQVNPDASDFSVVLSTTEGSNTYGSVTASPASMGEPATISESDPTTISGLQAKFTAPEQSVSYTFYARNTGEYLAYLNYITIGDKTCTAGDGTNADMVTSACNGISISVKVGSDEAVSASTGLMSTHTLAAGSNETVVVTISYAKDSALADGPFSVEFGDVILTYSTINNYVPPKVCKPVEVATVGNVPVGNYALGDEYLCDPGDGVERTFFVLEDGDNTDLVPWNGDLYNERTEPTVGTTDKGQVSLIMSENIIDSTTWCSSGSDPVCNGDEVKLKLQENTSNWTVKTTIPTYFQIWKSKSSSWLYINLNNPEQGEPQPWAYWTSAVVYENNSTGAWAVDFNKDLNYSYDVNAGFIGIRPVITVSKDQIG